MSELFMIVGFAGLAVIIWRLRLRRLGQMRANEDNSPAPPMSGADRAALTFSAIAIASAVIRGIIEALQP